MVSKSDINAIDRHDAVDDDADDDDCSCFSDCNFAGVERNVMLIIEIVDFCCKVSTLQRPIET